MSDSDTVGRFLWPPRIPFGCLTLLDGDPGCSKTRLICDVAARLSTGRPIPHAACPCDPITANALILSAEDTVEDLTGTLRAAGADLSKAHVLSVLGAETNADLLYLPEHFERLKHLVLEHANKLVVLDPIGAFSRRGLSSETGARELAQSLARLAHQTGAAVLGIRHLTKASNRNPLYSGGGAMPLIGQARSALLLTRHPVDDHRRILFHHKANLSAKSESLLLTISEEHGCPRLVWNGAAGITWEQYADQHATDAPQLQEAVDFLIRVLGKGRARAKDVLWMAREEMIALRTLRRAKAALEIVLARKGFGRGSVVWWSLPGSSRTVNLAKIRTPVIPPKPKRPKITRLY